MKGHIVCGSGEYNIASIKSWAKAVRVTYLKLTLCTITDTHSDSHLFARGEYIDLTRFDGRSLTQVMVQVVPWYTEDSPEHSVFYKTTNK